MRKLVVAIVAVLAIFTFIREYKAPSSRGFQGSHIEATAQN
jgi:hypothetical protein